MSEALVTRIARDLRTALPKPVRALAAELATPETVAMLFYGSILRTGDLDGVVDFYRLTGVAKAPAIWPVVSYHEVAVGGRTLRAKVATMPLATFAKACRGETLDTTIWTRFVQPSALAWGDADLAGPIADAVATAARFAAALGPPQGSPGDYWRALFRATYAAEFRFEARGREEQILAHGGQRFDELLPLGWVRAGIAFDDHGPKLSSVERQRILSAWRRRQRLGKPLNVARLVKAAFTFDGAARYAAWKIERHTGVPVPLTPWQERHPILAAPGVLWRVFRRRA